METLLLMLAWVLFCYVGIPALFILLFIAFRKPNPVSAEVNARLKSKLELLETGRVEQPQPQPQPQAVPPEPWAGSPGPAAEGGYWRKWTGTRRWYAAQDKDAWDRDFKEAEERPEPQPASPAQQPDPVAPSEVFARLRSRLEQLG